MVSEVRPLVRALPVYFTRAEQHRLLAACTNERDRLLVELLRHTGGRISEVLAARVGDITAHGVNLVNLKQGRWLVQVGADGQPLRDAGGRVVREHVRVREQKLVPVHPDFLAYLRRTTAGRAPDAYLVTAQASERPITRERAWQIITRLSAAAGIRKLRFRDGVLRPLGPHKLRHSHAVTLLEAGLPITAVQAQLGHHSLASTQIYSQIVDVARERMIASVAF